MQKNMLVFRPSTKNLAVGVRPYNLHKELVALGIKMNFIEDWKFLAISPTQIRNKVRLLKFVAAKNEYSRFMVEGVQSKKFMDMLLRFNIPIILDFRDDPILQNKAFGIPMSERAEESNKECIQCSLKSSDLVLFPSKTLMSYYPEVTEKSIVVMNASDPNYFLATPLPEKLKISLFTGAAPGRGIELLLDSCKILKKDFANLEVEAAWKVAKEMWDYSIKLKRKYDYEWMVFREDINYSQNAPQFLQSCYLTVIPHLKSPYLDAATSVKLFDSMAAARPVVVTNCYEQAKIVREEKCGLICNFTPEDMAEKIAKLLENREYSRKLGQNGRKAVEERHNWRERAKTVIKATYGK